MIFGAGEFIETWPCTPHRGDKFAAPLFLEESAGRVTFEGNQNIGISAELYSEKRG
jgi:hypothetical protein